MEQIVCFSGGKDSTALLLMMLERGMKIDEIIFLDTKMEFLGLYDHITQVEKHIKRKITWLQSPRGFEYYMFEHKRTRGPHIGKIGYGWPRAKGRWCTGILKIHLCKQYLKSRNVQTYIGIAADESSRCRPNINYPLVNWNVTEEKALEYCYSKGFHWSGLYRIFKRVSCWCCPLQSLNELRNLRRHYPFLWKKLIEMDQKSETPFRKNCRVITLEKRFAAEDNMKGD